MLKFLNLEGLRSEILITLQTGMEVSPRSRDPNRTCDLPSGTHLSSEETEPNGKVVVSREEEIQPRRSTIQEVRNKGRRSTRRNIGFLLVIFTASVFIMVTMVMNFPELDE